MGISGGYSVYKDPDTFYTALADFLGDDSNARFESDVVYEEGDDFIKVVLSYYVCVCVCVCIY